jgi:N-acetylmuramoyl-L-alanine amidase
MDRFGAGRRRLLSLAVLLVIGAPGAHAEPPVPMLGSCPGGSPKVVVDIGHSLQDGGAMSARGRSEFLFNRDLAHTIAAALARAGGHPVLLNEEGANLSLSARVAMINAAKPTLLLSVHHDSVQPQYLEDWQVDGQKRDFSDRFSGFSLFVSRKNVDFAESEQFARLIGEALTNEGMKPSLHHAEAIKGENKPLLDDALGIYAYDGLAVLRGTKAPAVLIEAGVIKHRSEELTVQTPRFREQVAKAVVAAVGRLCARGDATQRQPAK